MKSANSWPRTRDPDHHSQSRASSARYDWLRARPEAMQAWDLGGKLRFRYMDAENAVRSPHTITAVPAGSKPLTTPVNPNTDFIAQGKPNSTDELLERIGLYAGYAPTRWASGFVE